VNQKKKKENKSQIWLLQSERDQRHHIFEKNLKKDSLLPKNWHLILKTFRNQHFVHCLCLSIKNTAGQPETAFGDLPNSLLSGPCKNIQ